MFSQIFSMHYPLLILTQIVLLPIYVVVLVHAVKLQFKATQKILDHNSKVMIKDPGT